MNVVAIEPNGPEVSGRDVVVMGAKFCCHDSLFVTISVVAATGRGRYLAPLF